LQNIVEIPFKYNVFSVKDEGKVRHFLIRGNEIGGFYIAPNLVFATVDQLVQFYQTRSVYPVPQLLYPCVRVRTGKVVCTGVARNFDWEGPKMEKFCDVILVTFFGDVMIMTSLK